MPLLKRKKLFQFSSSSLLKVVGDLKWILHVSFWALRCRIAVMTSSWARVSIIHHSKLKCLPKTARHFGPHLGLVVLVVWKLYFASFDPQENGMKYSTWFNAQYQLPSKVQTCRLYITSLTIRLVYSISQFTSSLAKHEQSNSIDLLHCEPVWLRDRSSRVTELVCSRGFSFCSWFFDNQSYLW